MTNWHEARSSAVEKPLELDTTSSGAVVYERRNIRQETREMNMGNATLSVTEWVFEQREYTQAEYAQMVSPATQSIMQAVSGIEMSIAELSLGGEGV